MKKQYKSIRKEGNTKVIKFDLEDIKEPQNSFNTSQVESEDNCFHEKHFHNSQEILNTPTNLKPFKKNSKFGQNDNFSDRLFELSNKFHLINELSDNLYLDFAKIKVEKTNIDPQEMERNAFDTRSDVLSKNIITEAQTAIITETKEYNQFLKKINKKWRENKYKKRFKVNLIRNSKRIN